MLILGFFTNAEGDLYPHAQTVVLTPYAQNELGIAAVDEDCFRGHRVNNEKQPDNAVLTKTRLNTNPDVLYKGCACDYVYQFT